MKVTVYGILALGLFSGTVSAVNWNGSGTSSGIVGTALDDGGNWVGGNVPVGGVPGVIPSSSSSASTLSLNADFDIAALLSRTLQDVNLNTGDSTLEFRTGGDEDLSSTGGGAFNITGNLFADFNDLGTTLATPGAIDVNADSGSSLLFNDVTANGDLGSSYSFGGDGDLSVVDSIFNVDVVVASGQLDIESSILNEDLTVQSGAAFSSEGTTVVDGDVVIAGTWVFDAASSTTLNVTGEIDLSNFTLDFSGPTSGPASGGPFILAQYDGNLTGQNSAFTLSGLGPNQSIDFNFMGLNQIAIVPEPSRVLPVLLGFLPMLLLRRRFARLA